MGRFAKAATGEACFKQEYDNLHLASKLLASRVERRTTVISYLQFCFGFLTAIPMLAQQAAIVGTGSYPANQYFDVAPGQLTTLLVTGLRSQITAPIEANSSPLPTQLGGITVTMTQYGNGNPVQVPISSIYPKLQCLNTFTGMNCGVLLAVVVQIPFTLNVNYRNGIFNPAFLVVSDGTSTSGAVSIEPLYDNIHLGFLTEGKLVLPKITHANGNSVNVVYPAKPGEELVIYATGLGDVSPHVPAGTVAPSPAPVSLNDLFLNFEYRANSRGYVPPFGARYYPIPPDIAASLPRPLFSGMVPGSIGVYQINIVVPPINASVPNCDQYAYVNSNLTITVFSMNSSDSVGICVDTSGSSLQTGTSTARKPKL